jgi:alkylation response protein AidB-like acyl-CoA dehydrogenase
MEFSFTEEQDEIRALSRRILEDQMTEERLRELNTSVDFFDRRAWSELAKANLLGVALPSDVGGSGLGIIELCLLLEQVGRTVAPVSVWPSIALGALAVAEFGSPAQRQRLLPGVVEGTTILTAALVEPVPHADPARPATRATRDGDGWLLTGVKTCVPAAHLAQVMLVPAAVDGDVAVFLVDPGAAGVRVTRQQTTNRDPEGHIEFDNVRVGRDDVLSGDSIVPWIMDRATLGLCAIQLGVTAKALEMTAEYTKTRVQFDRPIATFQAVGQRAADAYINVEGIRLTLWQAAWRLSEGLPARTEIEVAKYWASEGGHSVLHAAQHLHGGIGVDVDYPLHRYFLWGKKIEFTLGGAIQQLRRIGAALATEPV